MALRTSKTLQKQSTPRSIGRLTDADSSGIIFLFFLVACELGVGAASLATARNLLRTDFSRFVERDFRYPFLWANHRFYAAPLGPLNKR